METTGSSCASPLLISTILHGVMQLTRNDSPRRGSPLGRQQALALPLRDGGQESKPVSLLSKSVKIIDLGPPYPWLTTNCQGTLAHSAEWIFTILRCYYHQDLRWGPVHRTSLPCLSPDLTPPYQIRSVCRTCSTVSGGSLVPFIFLADILGK